MRIRALVAGAVMSILVAVAVTGAAATQEASPRAFDRNLTHEPQYYEGEPSIAVNPTDPSNIVVTYLTDTFFGIPSVYDGQAPDQRAVEQNTQGCNVAVSFDHGRTWTHRLLPIASFQQDPTRSNCSDTLVLFDNEGVAYVLGSSYQQGLFAAGYGDFRVVSSSDGGRTWSKPTVVSPTIGSPGADPASWQGLRFYDDRPYLALDPQTQTLYVNGTQGRADSSGSFGDIEYLTASSDGGRTWSDAIAVGPVYPAPLGAAFGIVAFASPSSRDCSCVDLVVSADGARSVERRRTPIPSGTGIFNAPSTAADPTRKGSFAVMANDSSGHVLVYRTPDAGVTWSGPAKFGVAGTEVSKAWMTYSPSGVLAVGWRALRPDSSYAFYGAVSYDGGDTFTDPIRISGAWTPVPEPFAPAGDDTSSIWLTRDRLYAAWGDWRGPGGLDVWWGGFGLRH